MNDNYFVICPQCGETVYREDRGDHVCFSDHLSELDDFAMSLLEDYGVIETDLTLARETRGLALPITLLG